MRATCSDNGMTCPLGCQAVRSAGPSGSIPPDLYFRRLEGALKAESPYPGRPDPEIS